MLDAFAPLPDSSRLWLVALDAAPAGEALAKLSAGVEELLAGWRHKGVQYQAAWSLLHGRILAIAEPQLAEAPSGCAIDGMLKRLHRIAAEAGLALLDERNVLFLKGGALLALPKTELGAKLEDGSLDAKTPVLDLSLYTLGDLRADKLHKPLARTWIGRKYKVAATA